jgi:cell division protein FtsI/penicillin-binding protein 2
MRADFARRVRIIAGVLALVGVVLVVRLYTLQIMHGAQYRDRAAGQYAHGVTEFSRGSIFFTDKSGLQVSAATLASGYTLAVIPPQIKDAEDAYRRISAVFPVDHATFIAKATKAADPYEEVSARVPADAGAVLQKLAIPGVRLVATRWRVYPGGTVAAHVIGFMGYNGGDTLSGQYGVERLYDDVLSRSAGTLYSNFFADLFTNLSRLGSGSRPGADVVTSIEPTVQGFLEEELDRYASAWHPQSAGAIVMDPATGDIVAMAARPAFDPNTITNADPTSFANPLVERVYEFGSIMKAITMASALDTGAVTSASTYTDTGTATYNGSTIANYDLKARGPNTTMQTVLSESLNVGAAHVAVSTLGDARFRRYFTLFGLASTTGIDLPNEAHPLVSNERGAEDIETATASFGQGFAVTPIAMVRALAVLADHGKLPNPHVATALEYPGEPAKKLGSEPAPSVISSAAADQITKMLVTVVDTALLKGTVKVPELSIAAKTGTAQIVDPATKAYYTDRYLHSFFGYFPAYDARFLVFFYAVAPQGARYASETWTRPFMESVRFLMTYYGVEPDRATTQQ